MKKFILIFWLLTICASAQYPILSNMYFLDEDKGFIVAEESTFTGYRTINGGITWIKLPYAYKYIEFVNDSVGFLNQYNINGNLYKTTDKGETWENILEGLKGSVDFINENVGFAYTYDTSSIILKTINGGRTWDTTYIGYFYPDNPVSIIVLSERRIILELDYDRQYSLSTDGGVTWSSAKKVVEGPEMTSNGMIFTDSLHGFVRINSYNPYDTLSGGYRTRDGGQSWIKMKTPFGVPSSMADSINGAVFYGIVDSGYKISITHDGFITWVQKSTPNFFTDIFYLTCGNIYACGDSGYFAKSTDCGDSWIEIPFLFNRATDANENNSVITNYSLEQNFPNPFNPSTRINYKIQSGGITTIKIYDILGNEIKTLVNEYKPQGSHYVDYDASNLNSGVYFYKVTSGEFTDVKKMVFIK